MSPNVSTAANQLLSGELNAAPIAGPDKDRVAAANLDSVGRPLPAGQMYFNQIASNPTSDPAVRKALIQAVDLDDLTQVITAGHGVRATSLVAVEPRACVYDSVAGNIPDFDLTAAKATLDGAGWTAGADGKRSKDGKPLNLRLVYDGTDDPRNAAAELAQSAWSELGANVEVTGGRLEQDHRRHSERQGQLCLGHRLGPGQLLAAQHLHCVLCRAGSRSRQELRICQQPRLRSSSHQGFRSDR